MGEKRRKQYSGDLKARVAIEAIRGARTLNEIAKDYGAHPVQITKWKKSALEALPGHFSRRKEVAERTAEEERARLYEEIGRLKVELDWLKKNPGCGVFDRRGCVDRNHPEISMGRQCELLGILRSGLYYQPVPECSEDIRLKHLIDEEYTRHPFYGGRRITTWLRADQGERVNLKRVRRLMKEMGLEAIYQKPSLSHPNRMHTVYPYLLKGVVADRPNPIWATDITYIRLAAGFLYLVAILDWFSRYVVSWEVSVTMDAAFCVGALEAALRRGTPEIFNSDHGSQFTRQDFTGRLLARDIRISMDGRGRAFDNIFMERLWRTVKYEEVYLHDYEDVPAAVNGLRNYFRFYNEERRHQSLGGKTPEMLYRAA